MHELIAKPRHTLVQKKYMQHYQVPLVLVIMWFKFGEFLGNTLYVQSSF